MQFSAVVSLSKLSDKPLGLLLMPEDIATGLTELHILLPQSEPTKFLFNSSNSCSSRLKTIFLAQTVTLIVFPSSEGQILGADDFYISKTMFDKIRKLGYFLNFFSRFFRRKGPISLKLSKKVNNGPQMCPNLLSSSVLIFLRPENASEQHVFAT